MLFLLALCVIIILILAPVVLGRRADVAAAVTVALRLDKLRRADAPVVAEIAAGEKQGDVGVAVGKRLAL